MRDTTKDRTSPTFWMQRVQDWWRHMEGPLNDFQTYGSWFAGGDPTSKLNYGNIAEGVSPHVAPPEANLLSLVVRINRSDLLYRNPTFMVKPTDLFGPSSQLASRRARVETTLLNDAAWETNLFQEGRRVLLDGLLGPLMVMQVGYSGDIVVDEERRAEQMQIAESEGLAILYAGSRPRAKETELHRVHIDRHKDVLAALERGDVQADPKAIRYLRKHVKAHEDLLREYGEWATETVRNEHVFAIRVDPRCFIADHLADRPQAREWVGKVFYRRVRDVQNDPRYDPEVRSRVRAFSGNRGNGPSSPMFRSLDTHHGVTAPMDGVVPIYELVDVMDRKIRTLVDGMDEQLREQEYDQYDIFPSGPFVEGCFYEHPLRNHGVSPPRAYEAEQKNLRDLEDHMYEIASRAKPVLVGNALFVSDELVEQIKTGRIDPVVLLKDIPPGMKLRDILDLIDTARIPSELPFMANRSEARVERLSGLGAARMTGGDSSKTATAAAIVNESVNNLAGDQLAVWEAFLSDVGRYMLRGIRLFYDRSKVIEVCGTDVDMDVWPEAGQWARRDLTNDRAVEVVPGSSRPKNTAMDQKLLLEVYSLMLQDPLIPADARIEVLRRALDAAGIHSVDLPTEEDMLRRLEEQQRMAAQQGEGQGGGAPQGGGGRPRERESTEPSRAAQGQGLANVGGGRVPTGASEGDAMRLMR